VKDILKNSKLTLTNELELYQKTCMKRLKILFSILNTLKIGINILYKLSLKQRNLKLVMQFIKSASIYLAQYIT